MESASIFELAESAAWRLGCRPGYAAHDELVSATVLGVWQFDQRNPGASEVLRRVVAHRRAITALERWTHHRARVEQPLPIDTADPEIGSALASAVAPDEPLSVDEVLELFPVPGSKSKHHARNIEIVRAWLEGVDVVSIAARHGIHHSRVSQIASHYASTVRDRRFPHLTPACA